MFDDTLQQGLIWNASTYLKACKHSGKGVLLLLTLKLTFYRNENVRN